MYLTTEFQAVKVFALSHCPSQGSPDLRVLSSASVNPASILSEVRKQGTRAVSTYLCMCSFFLTLISFSNDNFNCKLEIF